MRCKGRDRSGDRGKPCGCGGGFDTCSGCGMCRSCCNAATSRCTQKITDPLPLPPRDQPDASIPQTASARPSTSHAGVGTGRVVTDGSHKAAPDSDPSPLRDDLFSIFNSLPSSRKGERFSLKTTTAKGKGRNTESKSIEMVVSAAVVPEDGGIRRLLSEGSAAVFCAVTKRMPDCKDTVTEALLVIKQAFETRSISEAEKSILKDQLMNNQPYSKEILVKLSSKGKMVLTEELNSRYVVGNCGICRDETALKRVSGGCRHEEIFCQNCISEYIGSRINTRSSAKEITCPQPGCKGCVLPEEMLVHVKSSQVLRDRVERFLLRETLREDPLFKDCAKEGCLSGGFFESWASYIVCMECSSKTCVRHDVLWHSGVSCEEYDLSMQEEKCADDTSNLKYLEQQTRICPGCGVRVEKESELDCNAMTHCQFGDEGCLRRRRTTGKCNHGGAIYCGTRFCWLCCGIIDHGTEKRHCKEGCEYFGFE